MKTTNLGQKIAMYRRMAGLSQEAMAEAAGVSSGTVRRLETGTLSPRMETLHTIARTLGVAVVDLLHGSPGEPPPVRRETSATLELSDLTRVLMPVVGLTEPDPVPAGTGAEPDLRAQRDDTRRVLLLYRGDRYQRVAARLPRLLADADAAVTYYAEGTEEHRQALLARAETCRVTGTFLVQIRQFPLAHLALRRTVEDARTAGDQLLAASGVGGELWALIRQMRLDEAEELAVTTMETVAPPISGATQDQYATWGGLAMEAAAAAVRNNRSRAAAGYRRSAAMAAEAIGAEHTNITRHWSVMGPVTSAVKAMEDPLMRGDAKGAIRQADERVLRGDLRRLSPNDRAKHMTDLALAYVRTGDTTTGMDLLHQVMTRAPGWLRHQQTAVDIVQEVAGKRRRPWTPEMRSVAAHVGVA